MTQKINAFKNMNYSKKFIQSMGACLCAVLITLVILLYLGGSEPEQDTSITRNDNIKDKRYGCSPGAFGGYFRSSFRARGHI